MHAIDLSLFASTFALIFVAEFPDKTALATLVLATRNHPGAVFVGVAFAFLVQTVVAVFFGRLFGLLPEHWVHVASGVLFLVFAVMTWFRRQEKPSKDEGGKPAQRSQPFFRTVASAFVVIFIAEWGDITQLATATLVAKYHAAIVTVFTAAVLGLWSATGVAVLVGYHAKHRVNPAKLQKFAAVAFAAVGTYILWKG